MEKSNVQKTQELWKEYPHTQGWINAISHPANHMTICDEQIVAVDADYIKAIESISYILSGSQAKVILSKEIQASAEQTMKFIFLTETEQSYHIESAKNDMEALKQYVACYACGNNKPFNILCDSGQMDMVELIKYANQYLLCNHNAIHAIYALNKSIYTQDTEESQDLCF